MQESACSGYSPRQNIGVWEGSLNGRSDPSQTGFRLWNNGPSVEMAFTEASVVPATSMPWPDSKEHTATEHLDCIVSRGACADKRAFSANPASTIPQPFGVSRDNIPGLQDLRMYFPDQMPRISLFSPDLHLSRGKPRPQPDIALLGTLSQPETQAYQLQVGGYTAHGDTSRRALTSARSLNSSGTSVAMLEHLAEQEASGFRSITPDLAGVLLIASTSSFVLAESHEDGEGRTSRCCQYNNYW